MADSQGRAVAFALAPGQAHEAPMAPALLDGLAGAPGWVVGDRGLSSDRLRGQAWDMGARPAIPAKKNEAPVRCPGANRSAVSPTSSTSIAIALSASGVGSRSGGPWPPAMRRPPAPSWACSAWPLHGTGSKPQSKASTQDLTGPKQVVLSKFL